TSCWLLQAREHMPRTFPDVACTVCGCVCDDLRLTVEGGRIVRAEGACQLAEPWLLAQNQRCPPVARIGEAEAPLEAALDRAAHRRPTAPTAMATLFVRVRRGHGFDLLWALRAVLAGLGPGPDAVAGVAPATVRALGEQMRSCRFGIVFFGLGLARNGPRAVE